MGRFRRGANLLEQPVVVHLAPDKANVPPCIIIQAPKPHHANLAQSRRNRECPVYRPLGHYVGRQWHPEVRPAGVVQQDQPGDGQNERADWAGLAVFFSCSGSGEIVAPALEGHR
jgi:hypothetical protein